MTGPLSFALAASLLAPGPEPDAQCWEHLAPFLVRVATVWQVLDEREEDWFHRPGGTGFPGRLRDLRHRVRELDDCPPQEDCYRFPRVGEPAAFSYASERLLVAELTIGGADEWTRYQVAEGFASARTAYRCAKDARDEAACVSTRRTRLRDLRNAVGEQDYEAGLLPWPGR